MPVKIPVLSAIGSRALLLHKELPPWAGKRDAQPYNRYNSTVYGFGGHRDWLARSREATGVDDEPSGGAIRGLRLSL